MDTEQLATTLDPIAILTQFWKALRRFFLPMLLVVALCAGVFAFRSWRQFRPMYESKAIFTVSAGYASNDILTYSSYYENEAAKQLASTFPSILQTDIMRELILQKLGTPVMNGSISASVVPNTNLFTLTVRSSNPNDAYDILIAVIENYPRIAAYMTDRVGIIMQSEPEVPTTPYNRLSLLRPAVKGALIGLVFSLACILLLSFLRRTITSTDDLKTITNLPVLVSVPISSRKKRSSDTAPLNITTPNVDPAFVEAFRTLRVKLLRSVQKDGCHVFLVTSTLPGEGKTTTSANLALTLASSHLKTLLIDADLRKQDAESVFDMPEDEEGSTLSDGPQTVPGTTLDFLTNNRLTKNGTMNLRNIVNIVNTYRPQYDCIVMDSSPCGIVSDVRFFCHCADSVIYVIRRDFAVRSHIRDNLQNLADQNAKLAGIVFNGSTSGKSSHGYGYGYGYGYRYGYGYGYQYGYDRYGKYAHKDESSSKKESSSGKHSSSHSSEHSSSHSSSGHSSEHSSSHSSGSHHSDSDRA